MKITSPEYFKEYSFSLKTSLSCGDMDLSHVLTSTLKGGSPAGFLAENLAAHALADHASHSPTRGYDLLSKGGKPIEVKGFNLRGVDLAPSDMKGKGRSFDPDRFASESMTKDFIVADTSRIHEEVSFVILPGEYVVNQLGHRHTYKARDKMFASGEPVRAVEWSSRDDTIERVDNRNDILAPTLDDARDDLPVSLSQTGTD